MVWFFRLALIRWSLQKKITRRHQKQYAQLTITVLFCFLAVLDSTVGHTMDVLSPFISVMSFWLTLPQRVLCTCWCCPSRLCVVFLACVHLALFHALSLSPGNSLVSSWCDHSMLASLLWRCLIEWAKKLYKFKSRYRCNVQNETRFLQNVSRMSWE